MKTISDIRKQISDIRRVVVLVGPTASGKTAVSLPLAERLGAEIISADSRQIYRYMDIGTAKPTAAERARIPHHFIDILDPDTDFNAGEFGVQGREVIGQIFARKRVPLVVGGSGLYIRSLIDGFFDGPPADPELRRIYEQRFATGGIDVLMEELRRVDPVFAAKVDPTKPRRMIRALEVYHVTGRPISDLHESLKVEIPFTPVIFGLLWPRPELHQRINARCREMMEQGLPAEVEDLVRRGYGPELNALNTVGYAEAFAMRAGELTQEAMLELFSRNTRRYAKRQMTWFRRDERISWIPMSEGVDVGGVVEKIISDIGYRISDI